MCPLGCKIGQTSRDGFRGLSKIESRQKVCRKTLSFKDIQLKPLRFVY